MTTLLRAALLLGPCALAGAACGWATAEPPPQGLTAEQVDALAALDAETLAGVPADSPALATGPYVLEVRFPGEAPRTHAITLELDAGGRLAGPPRMPSTEAAVTQELAQTGHVVSWMQHDMNEGPSARYVGLVDGGTLWGRVYVRPGSGWHSGAPAAIGFWRMTPAAPAAAEGR